MDKLWDWYAGLPLRLQIFWAIIAPWVLIGSLIGGIHGGFLGAINLGGTVILIAGMAWVLLRFASIIFRLISAPVIWIVRRAIGAEDDADRETNRGAEIVSGDELNKQLNREEDDHA